MENLPGLNRRIKQIIDASTNGNVSEFAETIGVSQPRLNRIFTIDSRTNKIPTVPSEFIIRINEMFINIDPDWLLTGKGDMFRGNNHDKTTQLFSKKGNTSNINKEENEVQSFPLHTDHNVTNQVIPLYNIEATAGLVELFQNTSDTQPIDTLSIPNLPKCDGAVFVTGDSMYPLLKSGDIIAYKQINDFQNEIFWGEMYLISVEVSGEEYISVKYIQKSEKGEEYIKLVSQNQYHQPKDVHLSKVRAIALVKASVRINAMG